LYQIGFTKKASLCAKKNVLGAQTQKGGFGIKNPLNIVKWNFRSERINYSSPLANPVVLPGINLCGFHIPTGIKLLFIGGKISFFQGYQIF
jgi:hypothetical protein